MLQESRKRFAGMIDNGLVSIRDLDLRKDFPQDVASLVMSVLTLQFVPINYRQEIIQKCHDSLAKGGALILVEKILGADAGLNSIMVEMGAEETLKTVETILSTARRASFRKSKRQPGRAETWWSCSERYPRNARSSVLTRR